MTIITGDCLDVMRTFPDNHFTGVVTDPPYGLKFMGKDWDHGIPGTEFWKEALRISRPGSHLLAFGGTRTSHRLTCAIEDAGWEIRDCIMWVYGSGFPKSKGCLKPAYEPIILARKKAPDPQLNIDGSRIKGEKPDTFRGAGGLKGKYSLLPAQGFIPNDGKGRWPANLVLDEEAGALLDRQDDIGKSPRVNPSRFFYCAKASTKERNEGLEAFPDKNCRTGCSGDMPIDDMGKERDRFKVITKNTHPTIKPLSLMRYLITLIAPPTNVLILDPFAGSGSTVIAARQLGIEAIGIEKEPEYAEIARGRVAHASKKDAADEQMYLFA